MRAAPRPWLMQERVLQLVDKGQSVFITGRAGTGKSMLLQAIIASAWQQQWVEIQVIKLA